MVNKKNLTRNFSRTAHQYDVYAAIQNQCGRALAKKLQHYDFHRILEIGCGTGTFTRSLRNIFPRARITAVDISREMIKRAQKKVCARSIEYIVADGEKLPFNICFDLIVSNAAFQWFDQFTETVCRYRTMMKKGGMLFFACFGPKTFCELNRSLCQLFGTEHIVEASSFIDTRRIKTELSAAYTKVLIEKKVYKKKYNSLLQLLKSIQGTGVYGDTAKKKHYNMFKLACDLETVYKRKYGDIIASYEVIFCQCY